MAPVRSAPLADPRPVAPVRSAPLTDPRPPATPTRKPKTEAVFGNREGATEQPLSAQCPEGSSAGAAPRP
eukprot:9430848-Alexandrium_andersonii.AAC.1